MTEIEKLINEGVLAADLIAQLKDKQVAVPKWSGKDGMEAQYDPTKHPVMNRATYPDIMEGGGNIDYVTRVTYDFQRLACKRMTELMTGIPVKRVYTPENDRQKEVAKYLEAIMQRNRIDSVNIERMNMLFAGCEVLTMWYAVLQDTDAYGFNSKLKFRVKNYSPMLGDQLYPYFDEYGDMVAMSIEYTRKVGKKRITYFDTYTSAKHVQWVNEGAGYRLVVREEIAIGKIPAIYITRPTPIWEDTSKIVYEMEWAMSRNGNYLRKNSKPLLAVFADEEVGFDEEKNEKEESRAVFQYPKGSSVQYITWDQAIDNLKFYINELRNTFFTQLQLPDWSYEKMSSQAMSGESRKQLFIDAQMKVRDESGRWLEAFDREINVVKALLKQALGEQWAADIDALQVEIVITPYTITDDKDTISNLITATGGKSILSRREAVELLGWSNDIDKTLEQIAQDETADIFQPYE